MRVGFVVLAWPLRTNFSGGDRNETTRATIAVNGKRRKGFTGRDRRPPGGGNPTATTLEIVRVKWQGIGRERERLMRRLSLDSGILAWALGIAVGEWMLWHRWSADCRWQVMEGLQLGGFQVTDRFLRACRGEKTDTVPIWFMRQAGRYQPEYRALRRTKSLMDIVIDSDLCCQVTSLPVEQLGVDAAILFSDIMVPLGPIGVDYEIKEGIGPVVAQPIRSGADLAALRPLNPRTDLSFMIESIIKIRRRISVPLIGFSGAPFTLASYLIEGGPSRQYLETKRMMWSDGELWRRLMETLSDMIVTYARMQVEAGAQALQLFDSWAGALSLEDYRWAVKPYLEQILTELSALKVPRIYFAVGAGHLLETVASLPVEVVGVDWRQPLDQVRKVIGSKTIQGNLDPTMVFAPGRVLEEKTKEILRQGRGGPHIFNLGHGVLPMTEATTLKTVVDVVHEYGVESMRG